MTEDAQHPHRTHRRLWLALAAVAVLLAVTIVPPLLSVSRYKSRITQLIAASLGRPVSLSSVEVRLLPWPGFVLTDLTVQEDPAYGAEPVLHASTVRASIRLLSLWRGRLEIGSISVDDASLNLVRAASGRWNLDPIFRTASVQAGGASNPAGPGKPVRLPYLEAANSRINIKNGAEKLPFSLVGADLAFWQEEPGGWRIQLRGQPVRTDVSLDQADTGVVRLEARAQRSAELRRMPVHLDLVWREAQLGQLSLLVLGSDPGWRGDLTGELHLDGNADAARIDTRLQATGVHRAEFAPAQPMDFDATCGFVYRFSGRALENLVCDSPLGDGHIRLTGNQPGGDMLPRFSVELDRIPVAAALDAIRTVRSGFGPGLEAKGTIGGKIAYAPADPALAKPENTAMPANTRSKMARSGKTRLPVPRTPKGPLTGSFTVEGFQLSGEGLRNPIRIPKIVLEPVEASADRQAEPLQSLALSATAEIPEGGAAPLSVTTLLAPSGYQITARGGIALARAKELAKLAGIGDAVGLDALAGDAATVDLNADGPWLAVQRIPFSTVSSGRAEARATTLSAAADAPPDRLSGTVTLHNANWRADYLASPLQIASATLHLDNGQVRWDPVDFSYGPIKGTASLDVPVRCEGPEACPPRFQIEFSELDAGALQAAVLGAQKQGSLLSTLIDRLRPSTAPAWPRVEGTMTAGSLVLGPVTLEDASVTMRIAGNRAEIGGLDAGLLGGRVHVAGTLTGAGNSQDKPGYALEAQFEKLSPQAVGRLLGLRWSGGTLDGDGKIDLTGFTGKELAASAKGSLHFDWRHGVVGSVSSGSGAVPAALARFDRWTADAEIAGGKITLTQNEVRQGGRKRAVEAAVTLGKP